MKKILFMALFLAAFLISDISYAAETREVRVKKAGYLDNFIPGDATLQPAHLQAINKIVAYLKAHPKATLFLKGSVSLEKIASGRCHINDDFTYYSIYKGRYDTEELVGEEKCEDALGIARAVSVKQELIRRYIKPDRIKISDLVDSGMREGDHGLNRAVSYWYLTVPKDTKFISSREESNGDLILEVKETSLSERAKAWWCQHSIRCREKP